MKAPPRRGRRPVAEATVAGAPVFIVRAEDREIVADEIAELLLEAVAAEEKKLAAEELEIGA